MIFYNNASLEIFVLSPDRYASQSQLADHQRLHSAVRCPRCGVDDDDGSCVEDVAHHYKGKHEVNCMLCKCQVRLQWNVSDLI